MIKKLEESDLKECAEIMMSVYPELQRQGYGTKLLDAVEGYVKEHQLAGFTLSTNRYTPAPNFYHKNGFSDAEHVLFMYKEISV
jgi:aminoglycoside 6'-N-acetyltransferase I